MKVFVTGASGWIGSAVVPELLAAGHEVVGLARSDASAEALEAAGAGVHRGDVDDPEGLGKGAADSDGVIHLAFQHDIAFGGNFAAAANADRLAVEAMGAALANSDRPFVLASGLLGMKPGQVATEEDGLVPDSTIRGNPAGLRAATALLTLSLRGIGVRSSVLRLPPTVHGDGDKGFVSTFVDIARESGVSAYVGDGSNRWPAVHRSDAATLACSALYAAPAGSVLHAVGDEGVAFRDIAAAIGRHLDVPTKSLDAAGAVESFGPLGHFAGLDSPASSVVTRELLAWEPKGPSLIEDLEQGHYFHRD
ncbi:MAG TPA: SDR family oxidoreductase [Acidimicrobiales bacterium]|jgi:nucleoside-diphosphate-sugar epimerase|nr:SDR family oxidoreductase [Acidimicrobiales bacterium]